MSELNDTYERYCDDMQSAGLGAEAMDYEGWLEWSYRNLELAYTDMQGIVMISKNKRIAALEAEIAHLISYISLDPHFNRMPPEGETWQSMVEDAQAENERLKAALVEIAGTHPSYTSEIADEWGEASAYVAAKRIAQAALDKEGSG